MQLLRRLSLTCLSISTLLGIVRGGRMMFVPSSDSVFFPYDEESIRNTIFANYQIFGFILVMLVGVFGMLAIFFTVKKKKNFAYLILVQGIFTTFFTLTHIVYNGFSWIHLIMLPIALLIIVSGVLQTPREF